MKFIESTFDSIAQSITSMAAVVFVMIMTISGMVFFSHTLFLSVFPPSMSSWERIAATWFMALAWEATVLITTVNTKHLHKHIPAVMALCSGVIVLFFIQAFDQSQSLLVIIQRWFVGTIAATINYIYADLFYAKWLERRGLIEAPMKVIELQSTVNDLQRALDQAQSKQKTFDELQRFRDQVKKELVCPHCKFEQSSYGTLHSHKGHCLENPRSKQKLNGDNAAHI